MLDEKIFKNVTTEIFIMGNKSKMNVEINTTNLNEQQIRLVKSINTMLSHVLETDAESEYFDSSSELLRLVASAIKKANFNNQGSNIAYDQQALEYCVDILSEQVYTDEVMKYDN